MITTSTSWDNLSKNRQTQVYPLIRLYYGDESAYIAVSSKDIVYESIFYRGLLQNNLSVREKVDSFSHKYSISNISLKLVNSEYKPGTRFSDQIETLGSGSDIGFYNRKCEIKLGSNAIDDWSDSYAFFTGIIRNISHDSKTITFDIEDNSKIIHKDLPRTIVNSTDHPYAPEDSLGKRIPICFGEIDRTPGVVVVGQYTDATNVPKIQFDDTDYHFGFDGYVTEGNPAKGPLYILNNKKYLPIRIDTAKEYAESTADSYIHFNQGESETKDNEFTIAASMSAIGYDGPVGSGGVDTNWSNIGNIIDGDTSTYAERSGNGVLDSGGAQLFNMLFPAFGGDLNGLSASIYAFAKVVTTGGAHITVTVQFEGSTFALKNITFNNIDGGSTYLQSEISGANTVDERNNYIYQLYVTSDTGADDGWNVKVYELGATWIFTAKDFAKWKWFANVKGRQDTGGLYTASAGDLIEIPTDILRAVALDAGLGLSSLNGTAFTAGRASGYLSGWKHAFAVTDKINSKDLFEGIGKESKTFVFFRTDNKLNCATIKDTYTSSNASIKYDDILNVNFSRTKLSQIKTKVIVHYKYDYGNRSYSLTTSSAQDTNAQTKYNLSAADSTLDIEAKYIRDTTTAEKYRDYLLKQWKQPHNLAEVELPLKYFNLELGDIVEFSDYPDKVFGETITSNATRMSQTIYKYWMITGVKRNIDSVELSLFQLHDVS